LIRFGKLCGPLSDSVLYLRQFLSPEASPKAISRRTSYLQVRLEFLRYPQIIPCFFNNSECGPPPRLTAASPCSRIGHLVSGLLHATVRPLQTRFPFGSGAPHLNLAACSNSPVRSTKSNRSHIYVLPTPVSAWFQVLFHSPPGVLFTFPSRYCPLSVTKEYLALGGGPPCFPPDFSCPAVLWIPATSRNLSPTGLLPSLVHLSRWVQLDCSTIPLVRNPRCISTPGLG
jgi:hypothetical protein